MRYLSLLLTLCLGSPAIAGVVSRDLFEPGDGLLTYDDVNQREWLDFEATAVVDADFNKRRISDGNSIAEFTIASADDVYALFQSGAPDLLDAPCITAQSPACAHFADWIDLLGQTGTASLGSDPRNPNQPYTGGLISTLFPESSTAVVLQALGSDQSGAVSPFDYRFILVAEMASAEIGNRFLPIPWSDDHAPTKSNYWLYRDAAPSRSQPLLASRWRPASRLCVFAALRLCVSLKSSHDWRRRLAGSNFGVSTGLLETPGELLRLSWYLFSYTEPGEPSHATLPPCPAAA